MVLHTGSRWYYTLTVDGTTPLRGMLYPSTIKHEKNQILRSSTMPQHVFLHNALNLAILHQTMARSSNHSTITTKQSIKYLSYPTNLVTTSHTILCISKAPCFRNPKNSSTFLLICKIQRGLYWA